MVGDCCSHGASAHQALYGACVGIRRVCSNNACLSRSAQVLHSIIHLVMLKVIWSIFGEESDGADSTQQYERLDRSCIQPSGGRGQRRSSVSRPSRKKSIDDFGRDSLGTKFWSPRTVAQRCPATYFSTNPVHCLRSKFILEHKPAQALALRFETGGGERERERTHAVQAS